jgi:hypothetical protein
LTKAPINRYGFPLLPLVLVVVSLITLRSSPSQAQAFNPFAPPESVSSPNAPTGNLAAEVSATLLFLRSVKTPSADDYLIETTRVEDHFEAAENRGISPSLIAETLLSPQNLPLLLGLSPFAQAAVCVRCRQSTLARFRNALPDAQRNTPLARILVLGELLLSKGFWQRYRSWPLRKRTVAIAIASAVFLGVTEGLSAPAGWEFHVASRLLVLSGLVTTIGSLLRDVTVANRAKLEREQAFKALAFAKENNHPIAQYIMLHVAARGTFPSPSQTYWSCQGLLIGELLGLEPQFGVAIDASEIVERGEQ